MRGGVDSCVNACIRFIEKGGIFGEMETQKKISSGHVEVFYAKTDH